MYIQIKNQKYKADFCQGFSRVIGFMFFFTKPKKPKLLAFEKEQRISLHMLFVFFPLLAVFLDSEKRIVEIKRLMPFTFYTSKKKARYVIEMPLNLIKIKVSVGKKIKFIS